MSSEYSKSNISEPEFYYCTISDLRDRGLPAPDPMTPGYQEGTVSDSTIQRMIRLASSLINAVTNQFYQPWPKDEVTNGTGSSMIYTLSIDKIIKVSSVVSIHCNLIKDAIDPTLYVIKERFIAKSPTDHQFNLELKQKVVLSDILHNGFKFVKGNNNWIIKGVFGDVKILPEIVTELMTSVAYGDKDIRVLDTTGIRPDDFITIDNQSFIVNEIKPGGVISVDPSPVAISVSFPSKKVYRCARIHDEIRDATARLVIDRLLGPLAVTSFSDGGILTQDDFICNNIRMEKTDNYTYQLGKTTNADRVSASLMGGGTGNEYVDSVLQRYLAPPYLAYV